MRFPVIVYNGRLFWLGHACIRERGARRRRIRLSASPGFSRKSEGLPGYWIVLFVRAVVLHPAGYMPPLAHGAGRHVFAFRQFRTLGIRDEIDFEALPPRPTRSSASASPIPLP